MNIENPGLSTALKTLWGCSRDALWRRLLPTLSSPAFEELIHRPSQRCEIGASGMIYGAMEWAKAIWGSL